MNQEKRDKIQRAFAHVEMQMRAIDVVITTCEIAKVHAKDLDELLTEIIGKPEVVAKIQGDTERNDNG